MQKIRLILLVINLMLLAVAFLTLAYSLTGLVFRFEIWSRAKWMILGSLLLFILMVVLFLIRKSRFPVPGIDYK